LAQKLCDEVWYVPVKHHHFGKQVTDDVHRLAMLQLILQPGTRVETYELGISGINYTYDTLEYLRHTFPEHKFSWIIGSDNLPDFHKWGDIEMMLSRYTFFVYPRAQFPMQPLYKGMIPLHNVTEVAVSSTDIRAKIAAGESVTGLVDPRVEEYIKRNSLYVKVG